METWAYSISAGCALVIAGVVLLWSHYRSWERNRTGAELGEADCEAMDRHFLHAQFRRRMRASASLTLLGLLIPIGDVLIPWAQFPAAFALYWGFVMLVAVGVIVLGLQDVRATALHSRVTFARIQREQRSLERELAELQRQVSDGRDTPHETR